MTTILRYGARVRVRRHRLLLLVCAAAALVVPGATRVAGAAVTCPNSNPIVQENQCAGTGTTAWDLTNYSENIGGFATQTSFNKGTAVPLKIARNVPASTTSVNINVYRMGYYGDLGGRLVHTRNNVVVNNNIACKPMDTATGKYDCSNWNTTYTIPATALPASGVYLAKLTTTDSAHLENYIFFVYRDDNRVPESKILYVLPTATYQAYNNWGGKSLYFDKNGGANTVAGTPRAVKVSFDRPLDNAENEQNRFLGPDFYLLSWMERQGYDISYTDDYQAAANGAELRQHKIIVISGHSEYWSLEQFNNMLAARNAGVNIASFSANTAYWKGRYEDSGHTFVEYKTVQGDGSGGSGQITPNDPGPDGISGTADDALGLDGIAGTPDDHPENATTTFRDNGAPNGDPGAPPGGRVGPDMPENQLFGVMYVGDNDSTSFPLTVPAKNANNEFSGDRIWRNTGISQNTSTNIGQHIVGWEWDAVPATPQYASRQPAGVKRLTNTNVQTASDNSWILDEGRQRGTSPPTGQPGTVNAVRYTASSGAQVFASGTMQWSTGLSNEEDLRIKQATYNVLSDMGVQPDSPDQITTDPAGSNKAPVASFTLSTDTAHLNQTVTFDASSSADPDGSITKYEWDLDGDGTFETNSGTNKVVTRSYTTEGTFDLRLRVTDNGGATDVTVRTLTVIGNLPPTASFTVAPNPAIVGQTVTFNASGSSDSDGTITKYEWDLDGNGTYETNSGTNATATRSYATPATLTIGLRVTDNGGKTATTTQSLKINNGGVSSYGDAVLDTAGLIHYWRLGETAGPAFADTKGTTPATASGGVTFGVPGGVAGDPNPAARFDGVTGTARTNVDMSSLSTITVEFWLNWDAFTDDDSLAMEFTDNFNQNGGGFLIDPNAPQQAGKFGVAIGMAGSRNNAFFARPSAGVWHHYAFVLDTTAPAATEIIPYVDGQAVTYTKMDSGTGAGKFANAALNFMSRAGLGLFGRGALDEVAIYDRALSPATIAEHYASFGTNRRPIARFTMTPNPVKLSQAVTFDGSTSSDPDGTIVKYEWDLDGNGTYELDSGSNPRVTRGYSTAGPVAIHLRVTDNLTGTDTETGTLNVGDQMPTASFTVSPNPAVVDLPTTFNGSASADVDGTIVKYEWDLDGDGTFELNTGTTPTATKTYAAQGIVNVRLRVTDDGGNVAVTSLALTVSSSGVSSHPDTLLDTPGLLSYWRMGDATGPTIVDSKGTNNATAANGPVFGASGGVPGDSNTAISFDGVNDSARANLNLSGTSAVTVEFWLKWNRFADDDALAMEFTDNFNGSDGGFLIDPNAPQQGGTFGVGLGRFASRNNVFFPRPSAGVWHHYTFVLDTTAPAAAQITPYVDGVPVTYTKLDSGTGGGPFANAALSFMSRAGTSLFGAGTLDEVAVYNRALSASTIAEHYASSGTNRRPVAALTFSQTSVKVNKSVTFRANGSTDPDGTIVRYQWDLDGNGSFETDTGATSSTSRSYSTPGDRNISVRVMDNKGGTDVDTKTLFVGNDSPTASFTITPNPVTAGQTVTFNGAASSDLDGTIAKYEWDLDGNGTFETNTGTVSTTSRIYANAATVNIGLQVTDDDGATGTTIRSLGVKSASYPNAVLATPGLKSYWRMEELSGPTFADSMGSSPATASGGGVAFGSPGALAGPTNMSARFDGVSGSAQANLDLSASTAVTVEFWLKWDAYADNDALALEFTNNFNQNDGGFLVDPNSADGTFSVAIGRDASRNTISFTRPSPNQWHHYVFVLDTTAVAATQITPYVDGQTVAYSKNQSGTGAPAFANSTLYLMSRGGAGLFGAGALDEVAIYGGTLSAATVAEHYADGTP
jgi:YD repeat-containing protein